MGTTIKAFGLDRNADAAEGIGGWGLKKKEGCREREGETGMSAERPVQLMPCTGAQNYLRLNDPIHGSDAPPHWQATQKPQLTSP